MNIDVEKYKSNVSVRIIFGLMQLLYEDNATYDNVLKLITTELPQETSYNSLQVLLFKYLNTMRIMGMKIVKESSKFRLYSMLYTEHFSTDDLKAINLLEKACANFPNKEISDSINYIIKNVKLRMTRENRFELARLTNHYDFLYYYSNIQDQIEQCEKLCRNKHTISLLYKNRSKEIRCKCVPKDISYDTKNAYLNVYVPLKNETLEIPINKILSISILPQRANNIELATTIVYKLKDRLAKNYKLKEHEYSDGYDMDGNLIVINKNEPIDKLLCRLMRYGIHCEIVSPKNVKEEMMRLVISTLENY